MPRALLESVLTALDAVEDMRFDPALRGTCPVEQRVSMPFRFRSSRD